MIYGHLIDQLLEKELEKHLIILKIQPKLNINSAKTGEVAYDWKVPKEWRVNQAYFQDKNGKKYCDFKK